MPSSEAQFIRDIQVQKAGAEDLRFLVRLNERVPIRIGTESGRTVVEFAKILRSSGGYVVDAETQSQLDRRPKAEIFLDKVDFSQAADRVSFRAELTDQAVAQVFALENPSRLVVDLYDTVLTAKTNVWSVDEPQVAVEKARVGQFQQSNPRAITRLVFDLREPGVYSLDSDKNGLTVSFYKDAPAAMAKPAPAPVVSAPAASVPAAGTPKAAPAVRQDEPKANPVPVKLDPRRPRPRPSRSRPRRPS